MILSHLCCEKINLEKYIAVTNNKEKELRNKWKFFCLYKIVLCPFSSQLLYFDLFLFATYLFKNLLNSRKLIPYVGKLIKNSYQ